MFVFLNAIRGETVNTNEGLNIEGLNSINEKEIRNMSTKKLCRTIFKEADDVRIYRPCRKAMKYQSYAFGSRAFGYSVFGLAFTIGLFGLIPYANDSSNLGLFYIAGGLVGLGLFSFGPALVFDSMAKSRRKKAEKKYIHFKKNQGKALLRNDRLFYASLAQFCF